MSSLLNTLKRFFIITPRTTAYTSFIPDYNGVEAPTRLMLAIIKDDKATAFELLSVAINANVHYKGFTAAHLAAHYDQPEILAALKMAGANLDPIHPIYGWTPMHHAASRGSMKSLNILIPDADLNAKSTFEGELPLHTAVLNCRVNTALHLAHVMKERHLSLESEHAKNEGGFTPRAIAAQLLPENTGLQMALCDSILVETKSVKRTSKCKPK